MKPSFTILLAVALTAGSNAIAAGTISGTITVKGTPPPEQVLPLDTQCGALHTSPVTTRHYVVGENGALANVVVMLKDISGKSTGATAPPAILDQVGCEYTPSILAIQTGQKLLVKNSDPVFHNVHATPTVPGNPNTNLPQLPKGADLNFTFPAAEHFLRFKCDVHRWMFAWVTVVDHPYFAVTDKDGKYSITNVPPGKYTLVALHRKAAPSPEGAEQPVEVKDGETVTVNYTLEAK